MPWVVDPAIHGSGVSWLYATDGTLAPRSVDILEQAGMQAVLVHYPLQTEPAVLLVLLSRITTVLEEFEAPPSLALPYSISRGLPLATQVPPRVFRLLSRAPRRSSRTHPWEGSRSGSSISRALSCTSVSREL
ncbi:unnamed protein product [Musa textilis]